MKPKFSLDESFLSSSNTQRHLAHLTFSKLMRSKNVTDLFRRMNASETHEILPSAMLNALDITTHLHQTAPSPIPSTGPCVVVANHPFGAVEGLALLELLLSVRADARIVVNSFLQAFSELHAHCFFVRPYSDKESQQRNLAAVRNMLSHVKKGGLLAIFPAGTVAHYVPGRHVITDPPWHTTAARIARAAEAAVVPVYVEGCNSRLFQMAGAIHPGLRTLLIPREFFNKRGRTIHMTVGAPLNASQMKRYPTHQSLTDFLRTRTFALYGRATSSPGRTSPPCGVDSRQSDIASPLPANMLQTEISGLNPDCQLIRHRQMSVYIARADEIPRCLREIGRLREETFRQVGEGTGQSLDIDTYDADYHHLFLWDHQAKKIAGAYRLGPTDDIVRRRGFNGLYTSSLFRFSRKTKQDLVPALEMGRSFVAVGYQKKPMSLALLWKGIGAYVCRHPRYCLLFGPVSISADYREISRQIIMAYAREHWRPEDKDWKGKPRNKVAKLTKIQWDMKSVIDGIRNDDELSAVISEMESGTRGIPVLLKKYINLQGRIVAFNLDEDFSNVIDGLVMVDLRNTKVALLQKFMGKEAASAFLEYHRKDERINVAS